MKRFAVLALLFLFGSAGFTQIANPSGKALSGSAPDLPQYRLEEVVFQGSRFFSAEQRKATFDVPVGDKFKNGAVGNGLDRLRQLYGDYGYINFTAVPTLQLNQNRGTVVLTVRIDDGPQFRFGRLTLTGHETRAGEADDLLNDWNVLSGKRYDSSALRRWLMQNATFLPNDGQSLRHVYMQLDAGTHLADIKITFP